MTGITINSGISYVELALPLSIADGGTGATTAQGAINNLLPSQTGNAGKFLYTDGTNVSWQSVYTRDTAIYTFQGGL